ncbi:hypothetical protein A1O3_01252 [Capronia epimyces CBS 606.96]|uniref:Uncharacterized protein n=1 Tax=Capronia epimyces CBS 606.96 TaxID=1182542 RepID=W9YSQ1_9EURO|nr:uncharacterized protein A1O3_01252 [Capronia epimyces CBS 606.96]EXJ92700.1 hypothetical protein A1O3_01252 [Capronia epimyces CBS 606.96]
MEKSNLSPTSDAGQPPLTWSDTITPSPIDRTYSRPKRLREPWRHSVSRQASETISHTVREFKPDRQRRRLFAKGIFQWLITLVLSGLLAACLGAFGQLLWMSVTQMKAFNALIVLLSVFLGNNLTSSLREYALMLRWRMLAARYRPLDEFNLLMHCDSLRNVLKLFWVARTQGRAWFYLNKTQWLCAIWLGVNILLQVLVALLGLTYNLNTSSIPGVKFGPVSVANLTLIRDVWGADNPTFDAQLGSANSYGIQGQDYLFVNTTPIGQGKVPQYGTPGTPTIYANHNWTEMTYVFQDVDVQNSALSLISHRNITTSATCESLQVLDGGDGTNSYITYLDKNGQRNTLDVVHVGPGATTYVGVLNSTCGPRCTQVMALQSANNDTIPNPSFYQCQNTISPVNGIERYLFDGQTADLFQMPDTQARIIAGAIGWTGFDYVPGDLYQYVRYVTESWWSPNTPADVGVISRRIMEFSIEAVAAIDYNGPRHTVQGQHAVPAQVVKVLWRWSATILGIIPAVQLLALVCVIAWGNSAIIRDESCLSTARLLRPVVEKLGDRGCLLTGQEIAEEFAHVKVKYGWREPLPDFTFRNQIDPQIVRHVDVLDESEGLGSQGPMPPGLYDGVYDNECDDMTRLLHQRRGKRRVSI